MSAKFYMTFECDRCGVDTTVELVTSNPHSMAATSPNPPPDWENIYVSNKRYDLCEDCAKIVDNALKGAVA